jgi:hypothetical protein
LEFLVAEVLLTQLQTLSRPVILSTQVALMDRQTWMHAALAVPEMILIPR